jgi:parallel beta-helix repeat protein
MNTQRLPKKLSRFDWLLRVLCVTVMMIGLGEPFPVKAGGVAVIMVDSASEGVSSGAADGICAVLGGEVCTLREAIKEAHRNFSLGEATIINFSIHDITINLTLGALIIAGNSITIDGSTNHIVINGSGNPLNTDIFNIQGNSNTIKNISIHQSQRDGIRIGDPGVGGYGSDNVVSNVFVTRSAQNGINIYKGNRNSITDSLIGSSMWAANICGSYGNFNDGIAIGGGSTYNTLLRDEIVCNGYNGVYIYGNTTSYTSIQSSMIGTNGTSYAMGNTFSGVNNYQASYTTLDNNQISRNGHYGVWLSASNYATLIRNKIGTGPSSNTALPNLYDGVNLSDGAANNTIGSSSDASLYNVISGNGGSGIGLDSGAHHNLIDGNLIGIGTNGTAVPNGLAGIAVVGGAYNNDIGSEVEGPAQVIAGNQREGIYIGGANSNHVHKSNFVGLLGISLVARGNGREGILIKDGANNVVEGYYANNGLAGIAIEGDASTGNLLIPYNIGNNGRLPIDLGNDGVTPNGSHTGAGPNHWQPYPVVTGVSESTLFGATCSNCYVVIYQATGNPAVNRGGGIRSTMVIADASGIWTYPLPDGTHRGSFSFIACTGMITGDCSEMSPRPAVYIPLAKK